MECRASSLVEPEAAAKRGRIAYPPVVPLGQEADCGYRRAIALCADLAYGEAHRSRPCWQGYSRIGRHIRRYLGLLRRLCGTIRQPVPLRRGVTSCPWQKLRPPRGLTYMMQEFDSRQGAVFRKIERQPPLQRACRLKLFAG